VKRPLDGPTHWHSDLAMAPLDTNAFVTAWLPLQPVPAEKDGGSALIFATGSHRDVALHFWHGDPKEEVDASSRGYVERTTAALELGDATWHHGWTLHCASANRLRTPRRALALSFFADDEGLGRASRLRAPRRTVHCEDAESYQAWLPDVRPGRAARHPLLPLVWDDGPVPAPALALAPALATLDLGTNGLPAGEDEEGGGALTTAAIGGEVRGRPGAPLPSVERRPAPSAADTAAARGRGTGVGRTQQSLHSMWVGHPLGLAKDMGAGKKRAPITT
jgi:hypothetical protein